MTINIGLVMMACGALTTGAGVFYSDWIIGCVGSTLCFFSGLYTAQRATITITVMEPKP